MSLFKCKICGGALELEAGQEIAVCRYCGTRQTLPRLADDRIRNLYDRANHHRRNNDFDRAMAIYEQILAEDTADAEAYWSVLLCRFGVEYVPDPKTGQHVLTVNRAQYTSILDDENYRRALQHATPAQRALYEQEAHHINALQREILSISREEAPFDVFICYKENAPDGTRTQDSALAQELYHALTREGYKVFFSRITLEDKLGQSFEPYIFAALNSAPVMVVVGTSAANLNAAWVRNEWSRYLSLIRAGARKTLIPAYRDMDPYDLPEEFSHLQALDMSRLGFMQDLLHVIGKLTATAAQAPTPVAAPAAQAPERFDASALLLRADMALEAGSFAEARDFCEQILNHDPKCAEAYHRRLLAELHLKTHEELVTCKQEPQRSPSYQYAVRFAGTELKNALLAVTQERNKRRTLQEANALLESAGAAVACARAKALLSPLSPSPERDALLARCEERAQYFEARRAQYKKQRIKAVIIVLVAVALWVGFLIGIRQFTLFVARESTLRYTLREDGISYSVRAGRFLREEKVTIPYLYEGYPVTEIEPEGFCDNDFLKTVYFPYHIEVIGARAFEGCDALTDARHKAPDKEQKKYTYLYASKHQLREIGERAFADCTALSFFYLPDSTKSIGREAFAGSGIKAVTLPKYLETVGEGAFANCTALTEIDASALDSLPEGFHEAWLRDCPVIPRFTFTVQAENGEFKTTTVTMGKRFMLTPPASVPEGHRFAGYYLDDLPVTDAEGKGLSAWSLPCGGTLTPRFEPLTYTVTFYANGASGSMASLPLRYQESTRLPANAFERPGYSFQGWASAAGGSVAYPDRANLLMSNADLALYAVWKANTHYVYFNANGATGSMKSITTATDATVTLPACGFTRPGYSFRGWGTSPQGALAYRDGEKLAIGNATHTLYALWWKESYSLTVHLYDGSIAEMPPETYYVDSPTITIGPLTREGYVFAGWTGEGVTTPQQTIVIPTGSTGHRSYSAHWECSFIYHANNGTDETISVPGYTFRSHTLATTTSFTNGTRQFLGWSTSPSGPVHHTSYIVASEDAKELHLYAVWSESYTTLKFNANGGTGTLGNVSVEEGDHYTLTDPGFVRTGYLFRGFSETKGGTVEYAVGDSYLATCTQTVTLYAVWEAIPYTITFDVNGGVAIQPITYTVEDLPFFAFPKPTRSGATFLYWTLDDLNGEYFDSINPIEEIGNHVLHANWLLDGMSFTLLQSEPLGMSFYAVQYEGTETEFEIPRLHPHSHGYITEIASIQNTNGEKMSITLPDTVHTIRAYAFAANSLSGVVLTGSLDWYFLYPTSGTEYTKMYMDTDLSKPQEVAALLNISTYSKYNFSCK